MKNKNRALTPGAKQEVIDVLHETWCKFPELRLVQLILNVDAQYVTEDYDLVRLLQQFKVEPPNCKKNVVEEVRWSHVKDAVMAHVAEVFEAHYEWHHTEDSESWPIELTENEWLKALDDFMSSNSVLEKVP